MIRARKKLTIYDLRKLKGERCLTHIHVKSPEEAIAAEKAGVDLMSCSFDSYSGFGIHLFCQCAMSTFVGK